tara:strand:+ start:8330 stop:8845 length:516 start_codon:yes stop_codon:yes gene_type:complete
MGDVIYILQLENKKFYIGSCPKSKLVKKLRQHRDGKAACPWTRKHHALTCLKAIPQSFEHQVTIETEKAMKRWGIKNVRGGDYQKVLITPYQRRHVMRKLKWENNACWRCGRVGHLVQMCKYTTYVDGQDFTDDEEDEYEQESGSTKGYTYSAKEVDNRPTPGMTWHSIPP